MIDIVHTLLPFTHGNPILAGVISTLLILLACAAVMIAIEALENAAPGPVQAAGRAFSDAAMYIIAPAIMVLLLLGLFIA